MPAKYRSVHMKVVNGQNVEEILCCASLGTGTAAMLLPVLSRKRCISKDDTGNGTSSTKEQNKNSSATMQEDLPEQLPLPSSDGREAASVSQALCSDAVKTGQKDKARGPRKSTEMGKKDKSRGPRKSAEQQQERVEVYVRKSTSEETSVVTNEVDKVLADGYFPVSSSSKGADEEDANNGDAAIINNVLESEFFKMKCLDIHLGQGHKNNLREGQSSEDYFAFSAQTQEGSERQDQIHEGDDDQMCAMSNHSSDNQAGPLPLNCETPTCSYDGLEFREVATQEITHIDLMEQSEGEVRDLGCPEGASATAEDEPPATVSDVELVESEEFKEKLKTPPCSPGYASPGNYLDQATEEFSNTDLEEADQELKPVGEACIVDTSHPLDSLNVTLECEMPTGNLESSSSFLSSPLLPEFKQGRINRAKWKQNSRGRKISFVGLERLSHEAVVDSVESRNAKARSDRHSEVRLLDGESSSQGEASVNSRKQRAGTRTPRIVGKRTPRIVNTSSPRNVDTSSPRNVDKRTPRSAIKRKAVAEQTPDFKPELTKESSTYSKNRFRGDHVDRSLRAEKSEPAVAKTSRFAKLKSDSGQRGRTRSVSAETPTSKFKSMSLLIEKYQPVMKRKAMPKQIKTLEPVSVKNPASTHISPKTFLSTLVSPKRSVAKTDSLGKHHLENPQSVVKIKPKSGEANFSDPSIVEKSCSLNRYRDTVKRKLPPFRKARKSEPALKMKSKISSVNDNTSQIAGSESAEGSDERDQKVSDSSFLSVVTASSTQDDVCASQNIVGNSKPKSSIAYILPPPEYISFNHSGDPVISDVIMNTLPQLTESGYSEICLLVKNAAVPSSVGQDRLVYTADLNSTPVKFTLKTSFPNKMQEQGTPESQTPKEISGSQKTRGKRHSKSGQPGRVAATLCSSPFGDSGGLDAKDSSPSIHFDTSSGTEQMGSTTGDKVIHWTCMDTTAWLAEQGLNKLVPSFSCIDGPCLIELARYFNEDIESASGHLHDMGFTFNDQMQLSGALGSIPTQTPKKRGRKPKSSRWHPLKVLGGTDSPLAQNGAEVGVSAARIPLSQWTHQNVSAWLTALGLSRMLQE
ncbi:unnamed protein product [Candidula unifasciata]|uniref:Uncharacterized protein n=1 Tax=Candidula unifasciata TaxID=100452 RepID=A0A8S3Z7M0_9EUPU|nr:unnamed protein product [Candidula unifasciata]